MIRIMSNRRCALRHALLALTAALACGAAQAGSSLAFSGGANSIEGAAGGGLTTWALIGGLGTRDEVGVTFARTRVDTGDFRLDVSSITLGAWDRVELSWARQSLDAGVVAPGL